jgi:type III secretion protein Q
LASGDSDFASLSIRIVFQAGQIDLTAGDVQQLAPGVLLPINRSLDEVVDIVANGKRIGRGELVQTGKSLAVRVTKLNADA